MIDNIFVKDLVEKEGYTVCEQIQYNERKHRYCYRIEKNGESFLLKYNDSDEQYTEFLNLLKKEAAIFQLFESDEIVPKLIESFDNGFICKYIENKSNLREFLIEESDEEILYKVITDVVVKWRKYLEKLQTSGLTFDDKFDFDKRYCTVLYASGPQGTSKSFLNKIISRIFGVFLKKAKFEPFLKKVKKECKLRANHGDFHLNNIMVTINENCCYIADLENCTQGYAELELAFFMVQVKKLLKDKKDLCAKIDSFVEKAMEDYLEIPVLLKAESIFYRIILFNSRF